MPYFKENEEQFAIEHLERLLVDEVKYASWNPEPRCSNETNDALLKSKTLATLRIPVLEKSLAILKHVQTQGNGLV